MKNNDGGPAFPRSAVITSEDTEWDHGDDGMSLRDWFAGQALASCAFQQLAATLAKAMADAGQTVTLHISAQASAKAAYEVADAMLAARKEAASE